MEYKEGKNDHKKMHSLDPSTLVVMGTKMVRIS